MSAWDAKRQRIWARLAAGIGDADRARSDVVEDAFNRLKALDPPLAALALDAFGDEQLTAEWMAFPYFAMINGSAYAALASGRRDLVVERLRARIAANQQARQQLSSTDRCHPASMPHSLS